MESSSGGGARADLPAVEEKAAAVDHRLLPGGAHGAPTDPGMTGVDIEAMPSRAERPGQEDFGSPPEETIPER
jgi:hypothetical protein